MELRDENDASLRVKVQDDVIVFPAEAKGKLAKIGDTKGEGGDSEFEQVIKKFLPDGNQEISETAALALGILANDASVPLLTDLLLDAPTGRKAIGKAEVEFRRRSFAAYGLAQISPARQRENARYAQNGNQLVNFSADEHGVRRHIC